MKVKTLSVGTIQANCYIVYDENTKETIVIGMTGRINNLQLISAKIDNIAVTQQYIGWFYTSAAHVFFSGKM